MCARTCLRDAYCALSRTCIIIYVRLSSNVSCFFCVSTEMGGELARHRVLRSLTLSVVHQHRSQCPSRYTPTRRRRSSPPRDPSHGEMGGRPSSKTVRCAVTFAFKLLFVPRLSVQHSESHPTPMPIPPVSATADHNAAPLWPRYDMFRTPRAGHRDRFESDRNRRTLRTNSGFAPTFTNKEPQLARPRLPLFRPQTTNNKHVSLQSPRPRRAQPESNPWSRLRVDSRRYPPHPH